MICDNDNVAPYGENLGIAGKCRYMAPEVVIGKRCLMFIQIVFRLP